MGEKMSLQAVRDYHLTIAARHEAAGSDFEAYEKHKAMADAIDAHLTQPAQAVDDGMLPDALVPHAKEWYRLCERRFSVDRMTISGELAEAIVKAISQPRALAAEKAG